MFVCKSYSFGNCARRKKKRSRSGKALRLSVTFSRIRLHSCLFILNINAHLKWFTSQKTFLNLDNEKVVSRFALASTRLALAQVLSAIRWHWNGSLLFAMFNFILYIWHWLFLTTYPVLRFGISVSTLCTLAHRSTCAVAHRCRCSPSFELKMFIR